MGSLQQPQVLEQHKEKQVQMQPEDEHVLVHHEEEQVLVREEQQVFIGAAELVSLPTPLSVSSHGYSVSAPVSVSVKLK